MLCQICEKRPATVHTIDIVNNQKTERHICDECYKQSGLEMPISKPTVANLMKLKPPTAVELEGLAEMVDAATRESSKNCPNCGVSLMDFHKYGTVGCANDYELFEAEIDALVTRLHGAHEHCGKIPRSVETQRAKEHQVRVLKRDLDRAVNEERFEDAAALRDRITALEREPEAEGAAREGESDD